jgi:hypothetical protein
MPSTQRAAHDRPRCRYPRSHATARDIHTELASVAANAGGCTSCFLDTVESMSAGIFGSESGNHHQGLARTHRLSDGSITFFLAHSELGGQGNVSSYRYAGPTDGEHVLDTDPLTVAPLEKLEPLDERHPADICFLPEVDERDAGYLFVTEEFDRRLVSVYRWEPSRGLELHGRVGQGFPDPGPNLLFLDRVGQQYYLGVASYHWGWGTLLTARDTELFPTCEQGALEVSALRPSPQQHMFPFPVPAGTTQTKLVRDATGEWYLLGYRGDPADDTGATDYVDVYGVTFEPFSISYRQSSVHIIFKPGATSFATTGTHHVEPSGRLLLSSSYRWARDEGPGDSDYVSRVDECPSSIEGPGH